jgi:hypothetical protein
MAKKKQRGNGQGTVVPRKNNAARSSAIAARSLELTARGIGLVTTRI